MKNTLFHAFFPVLCMLFAHEAIAQTACPNGDFENWISHAYSENDSPWYNTNMFPLYRYDTLTVWPVAGFSGRAPHIQTAIIGADTFKGQVELGSTPYAFVYGPFTPIGGIPYTQIPSAITGYYRYNLPGNDSALIEVVFKKAGSVISDDVFKFRGTGSLSSFTPFSFPLSLGMTPDSVIILASSSNIYGAGIEAGSWLEVDELTFTGTAITQVIPGGDFDNWTARSYDRPVGWNTSGFGANPGVTKSPAHHSGSYSVQLTTLPVKWGFYRGEYVAPAIMNNSYRSPGGMLYTDTLGIIAGYYMYIPAGIDTAMMYAFLTKSLGTGGVGGAIHKLAPVSSWTYFEVPIHAFVPPDSLTISFESGAYENTIPGSVLRIDSLHLTDVSRLAVSNISLAKTAIVWPNPAHDKIMITCVDPLQSAVDVKLYDMAGREAGGRHFEANEALSLPISHLTPGMYFCEITGSGAVSRCRFVKN